MKSNKSISHAEVNKQTEAIKKRLTYLELGISFLCENVHNHVSSGNPMEMFRYGN